MDSGELSRKPDCMCFRPQRTYDNGVESWYYLPQERQFVGYYPKTRQRIGAIGQNGFRPGNEPVVPFAEGASDILNGRLSQRI